MSQKHFSCYCCRYCEAQGKEKFFGQEEELQDHVFSCHYSSESESDSDFNVSSPKKVCKGKKLKKASHVTEEVAKGRLKIGSKSNNSSKCKKKKSLVNKRDNQKQVR